MMPGRTLHRLAAYICSSHSLERVVEPAIADLQKEYGEVRRRGIVSRAGNLLSGYAAILKVMALCVFRLTFATGERHMLMRALVCSMAMVLLIVGVLIVPPLYDFDQSVRSWYAATMLVPQAVPLAIPLGIALGIAFGLSAQPAMNIAKATLLGAIVASALSFAVLIWAMPVANQMFREMMLRELRGTGYQGSITAPEKGYNEMSIAELRREVAQFSAHGETRLARQYEFQFHLRIALAAATVTLTSVLLVAPFNHRGLRGLVAFAGCFAYWALIFTGEWGSRRGYLTPPIGAWLPNLALIATALIIASSSSSRLRGHIRFSFFVFR